MCHPDHTPFPQEQRLSALRLKATVDLLLYCKVTLQLGRFAVKLFYVGKTSHHSLSSKLFLNGIKRGKYKPNIGDCRVKGEIFTVEWTQTPSASAKCAVKSLAQLKQLVHGIVLHRLDKTVTCIV